MEKTLLRKTNSSAYLRSGWLFHQFERVFDRIEHGWLVVDLPDGRRLQFGSKSGLPAQLVIRRWSVLSRVFKRGALGFAEAYIAGDIDSPDLTFLLETLNNNHRVFGAAYHGSTVSKFFGRMYHMLKRNTKGGSRRNIHAHYDLGNEFFASWLDESMTYSSALFENEPNRSLEEAQFAKIERLCNAVDLKEGHSLLEIGSGWGALALHAAKHRGARVKSITISKAQMDVARKRVFEAGLNDKVDIVFQDYRDLNERYDRIISVEMFEAVGEQYWDSYFGKIRQCLVPEGLAGLQVITIDDEFFESYRKGSDFIQQYIFPGGMLISPTALRNRLDHSGLKIEDWYMFGQDYARTLNLWNIRFHEVFENIREQYGFDERFKRIWHYYLAYCEAGFKATSINVLQTAVRPG